MSMSSAEQKCNEEGDGHKLDFMISVDINGDADKFETLYGLFNSTNNNNNMTTNIETAIINNTTTTITNVNYPNDIFQFTEEVSQYSNDVEMQDATNLQSTPSPPIPNNKFNKKPMK
nr:8805_t:CDS:2 [Entrophospora candida]